MDLLVSYFLEIKNFDSGEGENVKESILDFLDLDFSGLMIRSSRVRKRPEDAEFVLEEGMRDLLDALRS